MNDELSIINRRLWAMNYEVSLVNYKFMFGQLGGVIPRSFQGHSGIILDSFRVHSRVILGSFQGHSGIILDHSGVIPGTFQRHYRVVPGLCPPKLQQRLQLQE